MAKVPRAGNVKTRLAPHLSDERRRALAEAFLADTIKKARNACDRLIVAFSPAREKNYFADLNVENLILIEQNGADLGEKMANAFDRAFQKNPDANVLLIGTDSPTFPAEFFGRAFESLESGAETVLGKSADGGFYLIGLRKSSPQIFNDVEWSSPFVCGQTTRNAERLKLKLSSIPNWYDVDDFDDLLRLRDEILHDEETQKIAAQTHRWLISNREIFDSNE